VGIIAPLAIQDAPRPCGRVKRRRISNIEQGISNVEALEIGREPINSIFDIPCSIFDILTVFHRSENGRQPRTFVGSLTHLLFVVPCRGSQKEAKDQKCQN
jgi:hypothetical protein